MTILDGTLWAMCAVSLAVLARLLWQKAPQLSIVDPMSSKEARTRKTKNALLEERMLRQVEEKGRSIWKMSVLPMVRAVQHWFRRIAGKLTALERRYVERQRLGTMDAGEVRRMFSRAKAFLAQERSDLAEKELVAVLTHDPKNRDAYEMLGRMYLAQGQYAEAQEALEFLLKLAPRDASVLAALGEVFDQQHNAKTAFTYYAKAKEVSPNNPKYLDFFITAAIETGELHEAQRALDHLQEVNPENQKIAVFEEKIAEKRTK